MSWQCHIVVSSESTTCRRHHHHKRQLPTASPDSLWNATSPDSVKPGLHQYVTQRDAMQRTKTTPQPKTRWIPTLKATHDTNTIEQKHVNYKKHVAKATTHWQHLSKCVQLHKLRRGEKSVPLFSDTTQMVLKTVVLLWIWEQETYTYE